MKMSAVKMLVCAAGLHCSIGASQSARGKGPDWEGVRP
jgi:hypothetical protein